MTELQQYERQLLYARGEALAAYRSRTYATTDESIAMCNRNIDATEAALARVEAAMEQFKMERKNDAGRHE